jgi:peptide/nickel transport system permease protein
MRFTRLVLQRLIVSIPCLMIIVIALFFLLRLAPGDAVDAMLSQLGGGDDAFASLLRERYGLAGTTGAQLLTYLNRLLHFDLGMSAQYGQPVFGVIMSRLPVTLLLMMSSLLLAFGIGSMAGVLAARRVNRWPDTMISTLGLLLYATPAFWFGLMGILVFSIKLSWLPSGGYTDLGAAFVGVRRVVDIAIHLILPVATLALIYYAIYLRVMRTSMLEVMTLDFVRTARAKGLGEWGVLIQHVLRNALLPLVTILGLQAGSMLGGAVVVESVFSLPGLGRLAQEAVVARDLNMLLGIVLMSALLVIVVNFLVDLIYARLDPRIEAVT